MRTKSTASDLRKTGISVIGDMPWSTHLCHFYETKEDLLEILVPFFKAGLQNNEFCMWVVADPLSEEEARDALRQAIPDADQSLTAGRIEIVSGADWYFKDGKFVAKQVLNGWKQKLQEALAKGYAGLRANGNEAWLTAENWKAFSEYERTLNENLAGQRMIMLCSYPLAKTEARGLLDVLHSHQFAVARRHGNWDIVETPELKQAKAEIERLNVELERRVLERTRALAAANEELRREIVERKQADDAVRESQQLLQLVLATLPVGVAVLNRAGDIILFNEASKRIWGGIITAGRLRWEQTKGYWHDSGKKIDSTNWASVRALCEGKTSLNELIDIETYDGERKIIRNSAAPVRNREGVIVGAVFVNEDVTERVRAKEALGESEERFRELAENISEVFWLSDLKHTTIFYVSPAYEKVWGRSCNSLYASPRSWMDAIHPEDRGRVVEVLGDHELQSAPDMIYRVVRPDGSTRWVHARGFPVHDENGTVVRVAGIAEDITENKQAEQALYSRELDLAEAQRVGKIGSWRLDLRSDGVTWSEELYRIFGIARSDVNNYASFLERVHPDDRKLVSEASARARESGMEFDIQYRIILESGEQKIIREEGFASRDDQGNVKQLFGIAQDVTEQKQAEEALNKANRHLRILSRRRIQVQEDERRNLARELHDQIGQALTATKMAVKSAKRSRRSSQTKKNHLDDALAMIDKTLQQVRRMTLHLRPSALDDLGLVPALRLALDDYAKRGRWQTQFVDETKSERRPDAEIETVCFRIALEALTNVLRHAKAKNVLLELNKTGDRLRMCIRDDGIGFDVVDAEKRVEQDRLGLVGMRERAAEVGGTFECKSVPGQGTEVDAIFPFHPL